MKNLTWQNPEQLFVAQELINKVKSKCCGIKVNLKNRAAFGSLERSNIVGICVMKWCGADVELETFHYKGQSYCLSAYYGNVLHPERKWVTVSRVPLTDIVLWEQIYNCLCREYEEVRHKH